MCKTHLDSQTIARFSQRALSFEEEERVLAHLVKCSTCRSKLDSAHGESTELLAPELKAVQRRSAAQSKEIQEQPKIPESAYGQVLDGLIEEFSRESQQLEAQRAVAGELVKELVELTPEQRCLLIRNSPRFHDWALVERLLGESQAGWSEKPEVSARYAETALEVAEVLQADGFRAQLLMDLKAEAWSYLANCRRIQSDLYAAQDAFRSAWECLAAGSGDSMTRARVLELESSLKRAMRDFEGAESLLVEAIRHYRSLKERHLEGRVLMNVANLLWMRGQFDESLAAMQESTSLLDFEREPSLFFLLQQNIMLALLEIGRLEEARAMLPGIRDLARSRGNRIEGLKLRWAEGLLFSRLGQAEMAEKFLTQAREGFLLAGIGYSVALISLDIAAIYLDQGRTDELRQLARETYPIFASRGVHREALTAWELFRQAAERDLVTAQLLEEVAGRIRRVKGPTPDVEGGS
ncbi:MAG: hypothetical protein ACOC92_01790 [bacterium]